MARHTESVTDSLAASSRPTWNGMDGAAALAAVLAAAGFESILDAVAAHAVFLHPDVVAAGGPGAIFPIVRKGAMRGTFGTTPAGRRVMFDDNRSAVTTFCWAAGRTGRERDCQVNHVWAASSDPDAYTALWNFVATPTFLAKPTDTHPEVAAALRYRAWDLYGARPAGFDEPQRPANYDRLLWAPHPDPIPDLESTLRSRLGKAPRCNAAIAAAELGWRFSA
jgi:hypothetical protein